MSRKQILLTLILSLGSSGALQANPLDSPGVVYIDGLPCNSACQSYMAWSDQALSARHRGERETKVVVPAEAEIERVEPAVRSRVSRQPAPVSRAPSRTGTAASHKASNTKKAVVPNLAATRKDIPAATARAAREKAVAGGEVPERKLQSSDRPEPAQAASIAAAKPAEAAKSEVKSEVALPPPATLEIGAPPATSEIAAAPATAASAPARTIQQQLVEATGMADFVTAIGAGREPANKSDNPAVEPGEADDIDETASASPDDADNLVALVLARPEISSLSDLNNKSIAIEEKQSASSGRVSAAFMAAGAAEVQFSEAKAGAIDRLVNGEVPAAVLTLASREAAERFPDIEGFRTFRVPLKARL
ncbi:hypothetical protein [Bradyrhizobium sp. CSA112]|uniref:hypothetical protein n=1 Tax=Bradyrhizobium sp. CSA112 TaxID=2699170 RepID=UPI0023B1A9C1|nr:hypothetical protein [Bradyrhizobium sp. CSA112]